jgi:hypothetical protein
MNKNKRDSSNVTNITNVSNISNISKYDMLKCITLSLQKTLFNEKNVDETRILLSYIIRFHESNDKNCFNLAYHEIKKIMDKKDLLKHDITTEEQVLIDNFIPLFKAEVITNFIPKHELDFIKSFKLNYMTAGKVVGYNNNVIETTNKIELIDINKEKYLINQSILYSCSLLYKKLVINDNIIAKSIDIPFVITTKSFKAISLLLNGNNNIYYRFMNDISDLYSFYRLFDYLGLKFIE